MLVEQRMYLGVKLDHHLSWHPHIDYVCNKANKLLEKKFQSCPKYFRELRVLCTVYTRYSKVMTKHSVNCHLVSLILFMQFSTCKFCIHGNKHAHIVIIHPLT